MFKQRNKKIKYLNMDANMFCGRIIPDNERKINFFIEIKKPVKVP